MWSAIFLNVSHHSDYFTCKENDIVKQKCNCCGIDVMA